MTSSGTSTLQSQSHYPIEESTPVAVRLAATTSRSVQLGATGYGGAR
jgi:hypothetical protein